MSANDPQRTFSVAIKNREMFEVLNLFLLERGVLALSITDLTTSPF
jgi:hypothetical protein